MHDGDRYTHAACQIAEPLAVLALEECGVGNHWQTGGEIKLADRPQAAIGAIDFTGGASGPDGGRLGAGPRAFADLRRTARTITPSSGERHASSVAGDERRQWQAGVLSQASRPARNRVRVPGHANG